MALWKKIALGAVSFIVLIVGMALFFTSDVVDPVDRQLEALQAGDLDAAYAETSIAFRQATSKEQFAAFVRAHPALRQVTGHSFTERSRENNIGSVKGTLTTRGGGVVPIEFRLVRENDEWKILGFQIGGGE